MTEVIMPKWGLTMEAGNVGAWRKAEGDRVAEGEILVEIATEKITNELESPVAGVLTQILCPEGSEEVPVGTVICVIEEAA